MSENVQLSSMRLAFSPETWMAPNSDSHTPGDSGGMFSERPRNVQDLKCALESHTPTVTPWVVPEKALITESEQCWERCCGMGDDKSHTDMHVLS